MPSNILKFNLENKQFYEAETRPTIFDQTPVQPKTKRIL